MTRSGLSRRTRSFLLWTARLALVAYLVQLSAIDHWHTHFGDVVGIEGSSAHAQHCHGVGDCSSSSGGGALLPGPADLALLPTPPSASISATDSSDLALQGITITPPGEPPQAA